MKPKIFLIIGLLMFFVMAVFLYYVASHPELTLPSFLTAKYIFYKLYIIIMALSFVTAIVLKVMNKAKRCGK